jgi:hypothetical protein
MKSGLVKTNKKRLSFKDYGEESRHLSKKVKTQMQEKAISAIDKALKRKDLSSIDIDGYNH